MEWALRDYKVEGQIGVEKTIDEYINNLIAIFNECKRVLKKEGTCWVVLGDTYAGHKGELRNPGYKDKKDGYQYVQDAVNRKEYWINEAPEKSLCMIPERFAIKMIDNGWILRNKLIWHKRNCMPSSAKDRFTIDYEYIYFFVKNKKYYFKTQYEPFESNPYEKINKNIKKASGNSSPVLNGRWGMYSGIKFGGNKANGYGNPTYSGKEWVFDPKLGRIKRCVWKIDEQGKKPYAVQEREKEYVIYRNLPDMKKFREYINQQRKDRGLSIEFVETVYGNQAAHHWFSGESYPSIEDWNKLKTLLEIPDDNPFEQAMTKEYIKSAEKTSSPEGRIKRSVWTINTKPFSEAHFAVFPEELVKQCLDAGCPENGTVLDMFMGSGTTALVALKNNRKFMGIELNEDYIKIANKRIEPYLNQTKLLI